MVLDETTEEGRLFHIGIVLGKKNFSEHHYSKIPIYCDSCNALVLLKFGAGVRYLFLSRDTVPE